MHRSGTAVAAIGMLAISVVGLLMASPDSAEARVTERNEYRIICLGDNHVRHQDDGYIHHLYVVPGTRGGAYIKIRSVREYPGRLVTGYWQLNKSRTYCARKRRKS